MSKRANTQVITAEPSPSEIHAQHLQWEKEISLWRDEIRQWQEEFKSTLESLKLLKFSIESHEESLRVHAAAIRLHDEERRKHEHELAEYLQGKQAPANLPTRHQEEADRHARQTKAQDDFKKLHRDFMVRWSKIKKLLADVE